MGEGIHTVKSAPKTDRSYQRNTEGGLNRQEAYTISKIEKSIRNRKTEKAVVVGSDGRIIAESHTQSRERAGFRASEVAKFKDAILTHNHPQKGNGGRGLYDTLAGRIGTPFSDTDIASAINHGLKEVRVVTPTYTYSMRRPKGGWGDKAEIAKELSGYRREYTNQVRNYYRNRMPNVRAEGGYQRAKEMNDRANVGLQYSAMKALAKKFGWEFTRRKSN